jgi:hypothetical protein
MRSQLEVVKEVVHRLEVAHDHQGLLEHLFEREEGLRQFCKT